MNANIKKQANESNLFIIYKGWSSKWGKLLLLPASACIRYIAMYASRENQTDVVGFAVFLSQNYKCNYQDIMTTLVCYLRALPVLVGISDTMDDKCYFSSVLENLDQYSMSSLQNWFKQRIFYHSKRAPMLFAKQKSIAFLSELY